jgi:hypothetical protein
MAGSPQAGGAMTTHGMERLPSGWTMRQSATIRDISMLIFGPLQDGRKSQHWTFELDMGFKSPTAVQPLKYRLENVV